MEGVVTKLERNDGGAFKILHPPPEKKKKKNQRSETPESSNVSTGVCRLLEWGDEPVIVGGGGGKPPPQPHKKPNHS